MARFVVRQMTGMWAQAFHVFSVTLLSLLLPLSFNILARLTHARHLLSLDSDPPESLLFSIIFNNNPKLLYVLVFVLSFDALIQALIARISLQIDLQLRGFQPSICSAWFFLVTLQVSLGLGIQGCLEAGIDGTEFDTGRSMLNKVALFVGLHEIMICWCTAIVRPVVVDGMLVDEAYKVKGWVERCALAASFGWLWWWKLRHEIESLAMVAEVKKDFLRVELGDFLGWWLYYMTLLVGIVRILKGVLWACIKSWRCRIVDESNIALLKEAEEKV